VRKHIGKAHRYLKGGGLGPYLVKALAGTGALRMAAMVAGFGVGVQLARGLGVEGYGYYGLALAIITIAGIPGEMGLPRLVTREVAASAAQKDYPRLFGVLRWANTAGMRISLVMAIGIAIAAGVLAIRDRSSSLPLVLLLGAPVIPLMALTRINGGALQALHYIILGQFPANLLRPIFLSLLLLSVNLVGMTLDPAIAMAMNMVSAAMVLVAAKHWLQQRLPATAPPEVIRGGRRWLESSIPMALADGMRSLQRELSILLVGVIASPAGVGLFRISTMTAITAATPMTIANRVAFPVIARLHAEQDHERLQKAVTGLAWAGFVGVVILCLPLLLASGPLLGLVFGESFEPAAMSLKILAIGQILNAAFGPNAVILNMTHYERRVTRAMAIALVLNLALVPLFLMIWGIEGASIGLVTSLMSWNILTWLDARRLLQIDTSVAHLVRLRSKTAQA
jgi:O-antigen/teichoic acid export membrane protein